MPAEVEREVAASPSAASRVLPGSLPALSTSSPCTSYAPTPCESPDHRSRVAVTPSPPPLVDYVCCFSHERAPFAHTCELDFLSTTAVLTGHLDYCVPSADSHPQLLPSISLPDALQYFVYPSGIRLLPTAPPAHSHSFVLTLLSGERLYAVSRTVWEPLSGPELSVVRMQLAGRLMKDTSLIRSGATLPRVLYAPHSVCLISRHSFTAAYSALLQAACKDNRAGRDEADAVFATLYNVRPTVAETPASLPTSRSRSRSTSTSHSASSSMLSPHTDSLPLSAITSPALSPTASAPTSPSSSARSAIALSNTAALLRTTLLSLLPSLSFILPAVSPSSLPHLDQSSLCTLLLHLSPTHVALLLNLLLCETSVLLVSSSLSIVSPCCEALSALLWPLRWPYIFIPLLPAALSDFFQAPQPFLIGVERDTEQLLPTDISVCVVDLDHNRMEMRGGSTAAADKAVTSKGASGDSFITKPATLPFVPPASFVSLPFALSWRIFELLSRSFPAYSLLHADEPIHPPSSLPSAAVPSVIAAEEDERDKRERKENRRDNTLSRNRPRRRLSPCNVDNVDSRYRKPLLTLSTCRLLHSGTEGEEDDASKARGDQHWAAVNGHRDGADEDDGVAAVSDVSMDVSLDETSGSSELALSNAVSPALQAVESWQSPEAILPIPVIRQESEPTTAPSFLPVPLPRQGSRSTHHRTPSNHRSSSSPPIRANVVCPSPPSAITPQSPPSPLPPRPAPTPSTPASFLPASFTMSSAGRDTDELSAVTPVSAYPTLTASRSFDSNEKRRGPAMPARKRQVKPAPQHADRKSAHGSASPSASITPTSESAYPPSPASVLAPSPTIHSPVLSAVESDRFAYLYNNDGLITLSASRAHRLRRGFLSLFVSLFRPYQQCIRQAALAQSRRLSADDNSANLKLHFDSSLFLSLSHSNYQPFLCSFLDSQLVKDFLLEKIDAALAFHPHVDVLSRTQQSASEQSLISSAPATPSSLSFSVVPSTVVAQPIDAFDMVVSHFQRRHAHSQRLHGAVSLCSVVWKLGASLPTWRERTMELQSGSRTIRCFSISNKHLDAERRYRAMREKISIRKRRQLRSTVDDAVLQATIDRLHEQRAAMRNQLRKGIIKLERGHTTISVPDERKQYPTPWVWELRVRDNRWLLCCSDRHTRDAWIRTVLARTGPYQTSAASLVHSLPPFAESALQTSLRLLREAQMRQFTLHIQHKVEKLLSEQNQPASSPSALTPHSLPLFTSTHTRRSLSSASNTTPLPSPHPAAATAASTFSSPSASSLSRALLCAELLLRHLHLRELTSRFRSYQHCFLGSEAVKYMLDHGLSDDVAHCIHIGNTLISCRVIQHVHGQFVFKADDSVYQFVLHTQQPSMGSRGAAQSASSALPASLVCTPSAASHTSTGHPFFPSLPSFRSPTAEDELLLRSLQSSLHIRTHMSGLFGAVSHPNTFRGSECIDWLVDNGVMKDDTDAVRWCSRMCRMGLIVEAAAGQHSGAVEAADFRGGSTLYRFSIVVDRGDGSGSGARRAGLGKHEAIQEEKDGQVEDDELVAA